MAQQSIIEVKERFNGERLEFTCELLAHSDHHAVILYRVQKDGQLADIKLARGTLSLGYYWTDRSYNAYHFVSSQEETLALYCKYQRPHPDYRCADLLARSDTRCVDHARWTLSSS